MRTLLLLSFIVLAHPAHADLELGHLVGMDIHIGTETISGYGIGTSYWPTKDDGAMLAKFRTEKSVRLVKDIFPVSFPVKSFVATSDIVEIPQDKISSIARVIRPHDGYEWYGALNVFLPAVVKRMKDQPPAQCEEVPEWCKKEPADCTSVNYWFTYNKRFPEESLKALCEGPLAGFVEPDLMLTSRGVFRFEVSGD